MPRVCGWCYGSGDWPKCADCGKVRMRDLAEALEAVITTWDSWEGLLIESGDVERLGKPQYDALIIAQRVRYDANCYLAGHRSKVSKSEPVSITGNTDKTGNNGVVWTESLPSRAGWYWVRAIWLGDEYPQVQDHVVLVTYTATGFEVVYYSGREKLEDFAKCASEWSAQPIEPDPVRTAWGDYK